tara:strand:- start:2517 stop:3392 length:876 start_codon:yes stop_codon:yes gene_type:complete
VLNEIGFGQRERLVYIDFCLEFYGHIARNDLIEQFQVGLASCSRDFATYRELAPNNLVLKHETKRYYRTDKFQPLFQHDGESALQSLSNKQDLLPQCANINAVAAVELIKAKQEIIASLTRAISSSQPVKIEYASLTSGLSSREIVPHAFLNSGHRWHVRAYDRKSKQFRDFVCTRILSAMPFQQELRECETSAHDSEWNEEITIVLVPHPRHQFPKAIELDYQMQDKQLQLTLKIAEAKYLLRFWNVDATDDHELPASVHHLWLKNAKDIKGNERLISALNLAPNKNKGS